MGEHADGRRGDEAFTKRRPGAPGGFFAVEAAGLRWLAAAPGGAAVAAVLEAGDDHLTTAQVTPAAPTAAAAEEFGRRLAATHAAGAPHFGAPPAGWGGDGYVGTLPLPHVHPERAGRADPADPASAGPRWGAFYARWRVLPFLRSARDAGAVDARGAAAVEAVCARLEDGAFDDGRPPARLHGDAWSGNVLWSRSGAVLIDPAAHGGHAETDLAMLALFGLPHLDRVLAAYDEVAPLHPGWGERTGLHQLHPLLVHATLFGASYGEAAAAAARRC